MKTLKVLITFFFVLALQQIYAQPATDWMHIYDNGGEDRYKDIYHVQDNGYTMCGHSGNNLWITRIDYDGNIQWSRNYGEEVDDNCLYSIIDTDLGDFVSGGEYNNGFSGIMVNSEGEQIWRETYAPGWCSSVIELKNGALLFAGESEHHGFVVCTDYDGNVIWDQLYEITPCDRFMGMRESDGGVVLGGNSYYNENGVSTHVFLLKINQEDGEIIWSRIHTPESDQRIYTMTSLENGGFALAGNSLNANGTSSIMSVFCDNNGDLIASHIYPLRPNSYELAGHIARLANNEIVIVGSQSIGLQVRTTCPLLIRTNSSGDVRWREYYDMYGQDGIGRNDNLFQGVVCGEDNSIVAAGTINYSDGSGQNGIVMKLETEILEPQFISWAPEDTILSVLPDTEIEFFVHVVAVHDDDLEYQWWRNGELVSVDTTVILTFEEFGEEVVECRVSDGEFEVGIGWHITVDNFFIAATTPDSLRLLTRRGNTLPFTMDVACVEPDAPTVEWTVVNRDNEREYLGEADTIEVCFDLAGEWAVEAEASWNGERESVRWVVDVRSAVWWWMPHEDAISVNRNEQRDFSVFPFDPDSDSLSIGWWLDGDSLDSNAEVLTLDFPDIGEHSLVSIVRDGVDADTILWAITVNESGVASGQNGVPTVLALHPPAPNPFNSTTTIGYSLPIAGNVSLAVYDLSGREVARLVDGMKVAGNHQVSWNANSVASGVYVVALDAGGVMLREKVVLVK